MTDYSKYNNLSPTAYAEGLERSQFMDMGIKGLWSDIPRIAGPVFNVQLHHGDNLMLHAAIYEAPPGSIIVVDAMDSEFAVAGGNVCLIAQRRGIVGFVIDGVIRDLAEIRQMRFPVFARGVIPVPGKKNISTPLNIPISCGGVNVFPDDILIADEEGIAVIPAQKAEEVYQKAKARTEKDEETSIEDWQENHYKKTKALVEKFK